MNGLPPSLRAITRECLEKDPARRPTARDLLLRLVDPSAQRAAAPAPRPPAARPARPPGRPVPPRARWPTPRRQAGRRRLPARCTRPAAPPPRGAIRASLPRRAGGSPRPGGAPSWPPARSRPPPSSPWPWCCSPRGSSPASPAASAGGALDGSVTSPAGTASSGTAVIRRTASAGHSLADRGVPARRHRTRDPGCVRGYLEGQGHDGRRRRCGRVALTNNVTFTFAAGARTVHETDQDSYGGTCVNTLTLREATAAALTFDEPQAGGCVGGTVTFTRRGTSLAYRSTTMSTEHAVLRKA